VAEQRKNREQSSRKSESRTSDSYVPASQLPMPDKRDGWEHRYVRTSQLGVDDNRNVSKRLREGWEPITLSDYPELQHERTDVGTNYPDSLEIGGLLLCKMPTESVDKRNEYYDKLSKRQLESVDDGFMTEHDPRMPKYNDSKSRTQFRKG
jgi:hypothetical protein